MQNLLDVYKKSSKKHVSASPKKSSKNKGKKLGKRFSGKFSESLKDFWSNRSKTQKILIALSSSIICILILLTLWGIINFKAISFVYDESVAGKESLEFAQVAVGLQNFELAKKDLNEAHEHFETARKKFRRFKVYKIIPGLARQIKAVDNLLLAAINITSGLEKVADLGQEIMSVVNEKEGDVSLSDISVDEKRKILQKLSESPADLHGLKAEIELAVLLIEEIPEKGLLKQVRNAVQPIKQKVAILETIISQVIPAAETLPTILGYPNIKTYLFLLQNNRELRPAGGFIGTYGILKLDAGEIHTFTTDNTYNLDDQAKDAVTELAPAPIAAHTTTQNWLMRDSNWSPDFPTSARKAEEKYHEEGGPEESIDGVIAVTPTFIESLLTLTGPVTVDGIEFTEDNLFETLEHEVEFAFLQKGIATSERKEVIGKLASTLLDRLQDLPKSEFSNLWETFVTNVNQKQIQIFVDDPITQALVIDQNWAGEMKVYESDFLMFVDANLAALKTDNVIERHLDYFIAEEDGQYVGTAAMTYTHTYPYFDGFHTRYRTYTRVYLPAGSELLQHTGFKTGDKIQRGVPTDPDIYQETFTRPDGAVVTYTVIGGFTSIEPGEEGTIQVKYILPESVQNDIRNKQYDLYVQKQAGTHAHGLTVTFDIGKKIEEIEPLDVSEKVGDNRASIQTDLSTDREISIILK